MLIKYDGRRLPELDEKAMEWKQEEKAGNKGAADSLKLEVWGLAYEIMTVSLFEKNKGDIPGLKVDKRETGDRIDFERYYDMVYDRIESAMKNYDPAKGSFSHRLLFALKKGEADVIDAQSQELQKVIHKDGKEIVIRKESLNSPVDDDEGDETSMEEFIGDDSLSGFDDFNSSTDDIIASIILFLKERRGKDRESRSRWFSIFFTEGMTVYAKDAPVCRKEREIIQAMLLEYLDFYMSAVCRTLMEIGLCPLKTYEELGIKTGSGEIKLDGQFPADVSLAFLMKEGFDGATRPNRSNQLKAYRELLGNIVN